MVQFGKEVQLSTIAALAPRRRKKGATSDNSMMGDVVVEFSGWLDVDCEGRPVILINRCKGLKLAEF